MGEPWGGEGHFFSIQPPGEMERRIEGGSARYCGAGVCKQKPGDTFFKIYLRSIYSNIDLHIRKCSPQYTFQNEADRAVFIKAKVSRSV